jgi:hypothetical protein
MPLDISKISFPDTMDIRETSLYLGVGEQRIRALVRSGDLKADNSSGKLMFSKRDLDAFKAQPRKTGGARKEGVAGKAFVIHVTADKLQAAQRALEGLGIKLEPRYNYAAQKAYQAKRRAAKNGQNAATANVAPVQGSNTPAATLTTPQEKRSVLSRKS